MADILDNFEDYPDTLEEVVADENSEEQRELVDLFGDDEEEQAIDIFADPEEQQPAPEPIVIEKNPNKAFKLTDARQKAFNNRKPTEPMSWSDALRAIDESEREFTEGGSHRAYMIFMLGCYAGYRISDAIKLRFKDILNQETIGLKETKTGKNRKVPIHPRLLAAVKYVYTLWCFDKDDFILARIPHEPKSISRPGANLIISRIIQQCNIIAEVESSHMLRKTFARRMYDVMVEKGLSEGEALIRVQLSLGHSKTEITAKYIGLTAGWSEYVKDL